MALSDFPRYPLLFGPSPVHRLDRRTEHLGGATVWANREDVNAGIACAGSDAGAGTSGDRRRLARPVDSTARA